MRSLLRDGDSVYVNPLAGDLSELKPGDIILLMDGDMPVVHRYLGCVGDVRLERADFSKRRRPVNDSDIIGLALLRRRRGRVSSLRRSPLWGIRRWIQNWLGVKR